MSQWESGHTTVFPQVSVGAVLVARIETTGRLGQQCVTKLLQVAALPVAGCPKGGGIARHAADAIGFAGEATPCAEGQAARARSRAP